LFRSLSTTANFLNNINIFLPLIYISNHVSAQVRHSMIKHPSPQELKNFLDNSSRDIDQLRQNLSIQIITTQLYRIIFYDIKYLKSLHKIHGINNKNKIKINYNCFVCFVCDLH
jgi:5,10-methylenetetrahydrofolate reductase